jgi:hypothetical protein
MTRMLGAVLAAAAVLGGASPGHAAGDATVAIYDATQVAFDRYVVIQRIGIGDWRSSLGIGGHASLDAARRAVVTEAVRLGADGIVNLTCFDQTDRVFNPTGYFCYANAVRLKK